MDSQSVTIPVRRSQRVLALGCWFKLRNLVAHRNARYLPLGAWPTELEDCVRQRAIPVTRSTGIDWTSGADDPASRGLGPSDGGRLVNDGDPTRHLVMSP